MPGEQAEGDDDTALPTSKAAGGEEEPEEAQGATCSAPLRSWRHFAFDAAAHVASLLWTIGSTLILVR